jgi:WD40 repeat protein
VQLELKSALRSGKPFAFIIEPGALVSVKDGVGSDGKDKYRGVACASDAEALSLLIEQGLTLTRDAARSSHLSEGDFADLFPGSAFPPASPKLSFTPVGLEATVQQLLQLLPARPLAPTRLMRQRGTHRLRVNDGGSAEGASAAAAASTPPATFGGGAQASAVFAFAPTSSSSLPSPASAPVFSFSPAPKNVLTLGAPSAVSSAPAAAPPGAGAQAFSFETPAAAPPSWSFSLPAVLCGEAQTRGAAAAPLVTPEAVTLAAPSAVSTAAPPAAPPTVFGARAQASASPASALHFEFSFDTSAAPALSFGTPAAGPLSWSFSPPAVLGGGAHAGEAPATTLGTGPAHSAQELLLVSSGAGAHQLEFLRLALLQRCPALRGRVRVSAGETDKRAGAAAAASARHTLLLLTKDIFTCPFAVGALEAIMQRGGTNLLLLHEQDPAHGGAYSFGDIIAATPRECEGWNAKAIATLFDRPKQKRELMVDALLKAVGAAPWGAGGQFAPPSLPPFFSAAAVAGPLAALTASVLGEARVTVMGGPGGMGKSTLAAAVAAQEPVKERFEEVLWLTVGRGAGHQEVRQGLVALLEELGVQAPSASASVDDAAKRVRAALEARAEDHSVLLFVDDLAEAGGPSGWLPHFDVYALAAPQRGACRMAITTREVEACASTLAKCGASAAPHPLSQLPLPLAAGLLANTAGVANLALPKGCLEPLATATGCSPFALQVTAGALRAMMERPNCSGRRDAEVAVELAGELTAALSGEGEDGGVGTLLPILRASKDYRAEQEPVFRAIHVTLGKALLDREKFAVFGLFEEDAQVPEELLGMVWRMEGQSVRREGVVAALEGASLLKRGREGCVQLHDLAWEYARAALGGRGAERYQAAQGNLVDRVRAAAGGGEWWESLGGRELNAYMGEKLLWHLREAGRGREATGVVWRFGWILEGVRKRGRANVCRQIGQQLEWEGQMGAEKAYALKLLYQVLVDAGQALEGEEGVGNVAPQLIGRLGGLKVPEGPEGVSLAALLQDVTTRRIDSLLVEAKAWDGEGRAWLRPVRPSFPPPGGACEAVLRWHTERVTCVCALGDGRFVSGSWDKTLRVWDSASGACLRVLEGHTDKVLSVCALGHGRIVSGSEDKTLRIWNAASGTCLRVLEGHTGSAEVKGHTGGVTSVCAPGEGCIVSGSEDYTLRVWDSSSGACLRFLRGAKGHTGKVLSVCALGDGRIVSGSEDKTLRIWDNAGACLQVLEGHKHWVCCVCALGGGLIVSGSWDKTLRVWDATRGACLRVLEGHTGFVYSVCALGGGRILSGSHDKMLRVWDATSGTCLRVLEGSTSWVYSVCALGDGRIVTGSGANSWELRIWNPDSVACLRGLEGHTKNVRCVCVLEDGRFVSGSEDKTLRVWDSANGVCLQVLEGHTGIVTSVCALGDGRIVSVSTSDNTLRVWCPSSGKSLRVLEGQMNGVRSVCALGDGRIVSGSEDKTLRIWDTAGACSQVLVGHTDKVLSVCALGDGRLVSGSSDKTLRIWDSNSGACLRVLEGHTSFVFSVYALGDGRIASVSPSDKTLRVWDPVTFACLETAAGNSVAGSSLRYSPRAAELLSSALPGFELPWELCHGRTPAHCTLGGIAPLHLAANVSCSALVTLATGVRVFVVFTGVQGHFLEVKDPGCA